MNYQYLYTRLYKYVGETQEGIYMTNSNHFIMVDVMIEKVNDTEN